MKELCTVQHEPPATDKVCAPPGGPHVNESGSSPSRRDNEWGRERESTEVDKDNTSHAHVSTGKGVKKKKNQQPDRGEKEQREENSKHASISVFILSCKNKSPYSGTDSK